MTKYLSVAQVQEIIGLSRPTIWRWSRDGRLPAPKRLGRRIYFAEDELKQHLENAPTAYRKAS